MNRQDANRNSSNFAAQATGLLMLVVTAMMLAAFLGR
jgi:hypothetical protein